MEVTAERPEAVTNPVLLVEALSDSTKDYDRCDKFDLYKAIPTFREYVLIEQSKVLVEQFVRSDAGVWTLRKYTGLDDVLALESIDASIPVSEIYRQVEGLVQL